MSEQKQAYFYLHIPSSGGTTMWSILREVYGSAEVNRLKSSEDDAELAAGGSDETGSAASQRVVGGHWRSWRAAKVFPGRQMFTVLRNPVDQAISAYSRSVRNGKKAPPKGDFGKGLLEHVKELKDFGRIGGYLGPRKARLAKTDAEMEAVLAATREGMSSDFMLVGLSERYNQTLFLLADLMGWKDVPVYDRRNVGEKPDKALDPALRAELESLRAAELGLYHHAVALFDAKWAAFRTPEIDAKVAAYEAALKAREQELLDEHGGQTPFVKA